MGMFQEGRKAMAVTVERWHKRLGHTSQEKLAKMVETQFSKLVKRIRCDNGGEFTSNLMLNFYTKQGILLETTCPHTPQQNRVFERKHRHLLDTARALRFEEKLPKRFWGECVLTAAYIINRLPSKTIGDKTPYEILHNQKPEYDHMKVFGCLTYFWSIETKGDKFEVRGRLGIFLGYPQGTKGYKIFDIEDKKMVVSRDVKFHENTFTFPAQNQPGNDDDIFVPSEAQYFEGPDYEQIPTTNDTTNNGPESGIESDQVDDEGPSSVNEESSNGLESGPNEGRTERPRRDRALPKRLNDFVVDLSPSVDHAHTAPTQAASTVHPSTNYISYDNFSHTHKLFLAAIITTDEPKSFKQAMQDPKWVEAMQREIQALEKNNTWTIESLPEGKQAIDSKWVYKIKYKPNGEVERYKARLVAKGFTQIEDEEVYMKIPQGFSKDNENRVCRLRKTLYGLKQASRNWYQKFTNALLGLSFSSSRADHSLFLYKDEDTFISILIYVDDVIIVGNNFAKIQEIKNCLHDRFSIKDLGQLKYFLGIEVARTSRGLVLSQRKYTLDILEDSGMEGCRPSIFPIEQNLKLGMDKEDPKVDAGVYRRLIGRLLYLQATRPDIAFSVNTLSQFVSNPRQSHMNVVTRILRYLKATPGQGILLSKEEGTNLVAYSDSDWLGCSLTRRSRTGELIWLRWLLQELGVSQTSPTTLFCDNQAARHIANNPVFHERTKHVEMDCYFVRERVESREICAMPIDSKLQLADLLTKDLGASQLRFLLGKLGVVDLHTPA
ncbi:putative RNA-directed DNA polymerase [Helianthus annuus]|uniref:RNA-directed DNA polymerase n=1 Tax=Helianthus annuus TaxID=4232 RepID=A0A9K3HLD9_HELAN|nr:putative RNA-directed DNA polymerase [Helianthus annuus]KAJ0873785.1 putative RNA-directed DNA polymerase [Helianthus annuus]